MCFDDEIILVVIYSDKMILVDNQEMINILCNVGFHKITLVILQMASGQW